MNHSQVVDDIINLLNDFNSFGVTMKESTSLVDDIGLDSLSMIQFITLLEHQLGISVLDSEVNRENFANVGSLARFVARKITG